MDLPLPSSLVKIRIGIWVEMGFNGFTQEQAKKNNMSGWKNTNVACCRSNWPDFPTPGSHILTLAMS